MMEVVLGRGANYVGTLLRSSTFGSFSSSTVRCLCLHEPRKWNISQYDTKVKERLLFIHNQFSEFNLPIISRNVQYISLLSNGILSRTFSSKIPQDESKNKNEASAIQKPNIFQKMKQLTKDYWHILIPVHIATSLVWVSIFYTAAKNGVDIISLMEYVHMPEKYIDMIRNSNAGNWAVTYALYKVFTPLRYTVTVGGTTMSIRYLDKMGYLKFKRRSTEATPSNKSSSNTKEKTNESNSKGLERK